ncbi:MAG: Ig-like domain-containing protein, partial [Arcicella sp.]|nr:Ig-like domain-containing protein [Arcicella sp.]
LSSNGAFTYTPATGYVGKDSIQYEACNSASQCVKAWAVFTVTSPAPVANRDAYTTALNTPVSGNVLTNDTPAGTLTVKISPFPTPLHGSLTLSTNGAFTYTPVTGYVGKDSIQYEACNSASQCVKAWAVFTVTGGNNPNTEIDLSLTKVANKKKVAIGDIIIFTLSVKNEGTNLATGVSVKDFMPAGALYQTYATANGTYDNATGIWNIGSVPFGQTVTLNIAVKALAEGTYFNKAEIWTVNETDIDSKPANSQTTGQTSNPFLEDDYAIACFYVPVQICEGSGDAFVISVPTGYTNIQWYKDNVAIQGATASMLTVSTPGSYTFTSLEGTCPAGGCCPAEFISVNCCKPDICVPYTVLKTKSAKK